MPKPTLRFLDWHYLHTNLVWIYEGRPQKSSGATVRQYYTAWRIEQGWVRIRMEGGEYQARAGEWILLPPGRDDRRFSSNAKILSLFFSARWMTGLPLFEFNRPLCFSATETAGWLTPTRPMLREVKRLFPRAYHLLPVQLVDYSTYSLLQHHLQSWIARIWPALEARGATVHLLQPNNNRARAMRQQIETHSLREPFRLAKLAQESGFSASQVNRIFYAAFSTTPKRYFEERRLEQAKSDLRGTARPIKEIAWELGFTHNALFSGWFRKKTGLSPRTFRETAGT